MSNPGTDQVDRRRDVLIYRNQLFRSSDSYIVEQARTMRRFRPIFVGRSLEGIAPKDARIVTLEDASGLSRFRHLHFRNHHPLMKRLRDARPVLVHAHFGVDGVYALPIASALGVPLVVSFHGFDATMTGGALWSSGQAALRNYVLFRRKLARSGALFLCSSDFLRKKLLSRGFPEARTRTHYIGVDPDALQQKQGTRQAGLVLHVARLVDMKGTSQLLEAFAKVCRSISQLELVIIGDGPLRSELIVQASALGIKDQTRFLGIVPHNEVLDWLRRAAVLCQPSIRAASGAEEGLGMVLLEAGALGVPVVATKTGGIPEAVVDGKTGLLVPEGDVDALAERLEWLLDNAPQAVAMGRAGRERVSTKFNLNRQTEMLEALYAKLL